MTTKMITIPQADFDAMSARLEDLDDIIAGYEAMSGATLPHEFAMRVIEGEHPVRVWRDYRKMTLASLSEGTGISKGYLSEIETGKKPGSLEAHKAIAEALNTTIDALTV